MSKPSNLLEVSTKHDGFEETKESSQLNSVEILLNERRKHRTWPPALGTSWQWPIPSVPSTKAEPATDLEKSQRSANLDNVTKTAPAADNATDSKREAMSESTAELHEKQLQKKVVSFQETFVKSYFELQPAAGISRGALRRGNSQSTAQLSKFLLRDNNNLLLAGLASGKSWEDWQYWRITMDDVMTLLKHSDPLQQQQDRRSAVFRGRVAGGFFSVFAGIAGLVSFVAPNRSSIGYAFLGLALAGPYLGGKMGQDGFDRSMERTRKIMRNIDRYWQEPSSEQ